MASGEWLAANGDANVEFTTVVLSLRMRIRRTAVLSSPTATSDRLRLPIFDGLRLEAGGIGARCEVPRCSPAPDGREHLAVIAIRLADLVTDLSQRVAKNRNRSLVEALRLVGSALPGVQVREVAGEHSDIGVSFTAGFDRQPDGVEVILSASSGRWVADWTRARPF